MPIKLDEVRRVALALPETTEEPHHHFGSFRVRGKIFATIPPGGNLLHIFLPEQARELALAMDPQFLEPVRWGSKVLGVRANLAAARKATVLALVRKAYEYKAAAKASPRAR
ncbi:MAG: MmcQ/YjbR family DNA-binding protein [Rubrivivax sp.]|nr:MmcQ/YjbR family DNA-binding protein [Rubrivivax sp.]